MVDSTGPPTSTADQGARAHRVVIVGGGFGGLFAAKFLRRAPVEVTLVDGRNYHLFQPLLYQLATGILSAGEVAPPIRDVLRHHANVTVEMATVKDFDLAGRTVTARRPDDTVRTYQYDTLIVAAGAAQSYFGHDEFARFAPGMKTIDDALELRGRIFGAFEMAENETDPEARRAWLTSWWSAAARPVSRSPARSRSCRARGSAATSAASTRPKPRSCSSTAARDPRRVRRPALREGGERVATARRDDPDRAVVTGVDAFGVDVRTADGSHERLVARTKIWAAGVQASPLAGLLAQASGATCDRAGRIAYARTAPCPAIPRCSRSAT